MPKRRRRRAHGGGQLVPPKMSGGTWGIRWRQGKRRLFKGGFTTREMAEKVLAKVVGEIATGRAGLPADTRNVPALGDLAEPFLEPRKLTHRTAAEDRYRWRMHLGPFFSKYRPHEVDTSVIRRFIELKLKDGLNPATVRILVSILSSLFMDLVEDGKTPTNPCRALPRSVRRLIKPIYDPRTTPFIEKLDDVRRIHLALPEPLNIAYAIGALAGLRTGEVFALKWEHVDLAARRIHVRESIKGPLKDKDSRVVPIIDALLPILTTWKLKIGGTGIVLPPLRRDGWKVDKSTPGKYLRKVLVQLRLDRDGLGWYEATRHTFASQWVLAGGSIEKLKELLGHYSVVMTERYAHLRPDLFSATDLNMIRVDLTPAQARLSRVERPHEHHVEAGAGGPQEASRRSGSSNRRS